MEDTSKLYIWILLLLAWNAMLLMFLIAFLLLKPPIERNVAEVAAQCREATLAALKDTCTNL